MELVALQEHTTLVEVEPGEHLYNQDDIDRGLFFIESGIMVSYGRVIP
jgi:CRP-like cAMP-binding protein